MPTPSPIARLVIPAQAGIHADARADRNETERPRAWIPAFAGMTDLQRARRTSRGAPYGFGPCPSLSSHFSSLRVTKRYTGLPVRNHRPRTHDGRFSTRRSVGVRRCGQ
jgi:hypothetical protein